MEPKPEVRDSVRPATLIRFPMIQNAAAMGYALKLTHDYFTNPTALALGWTPPPIPPGVMGFVPCTLLVTDAFDVVTGKNIGRIRFLQNVEGVDTEVTHFDQEWTLTLGYT